jgi:hypothetical protein
MSFTTRERHVAIVVSNNDPEKRGRLRVATASLLGDDGTGGAKEWPTWIEPIFDGVQANGGGFFVIPTPGVKVELEVSVSSVSDQAPGQTMTTNPDPKWRACMVEQGDSLHPEMRANYPNRAGYVSPTGHLLIFDSSADGDVFLRHSIGTQVLLTGDGKISIGNAAGVELLNILDQLLTTLLIFAKATAPHTPGSPTVGAAAAAMDPLLTALQETLGIILGPAGPTGTAGTL